MKEINVNELKALKDDGKEFELIDVREPHEVDIAEIGGQLIPMGTVPQHLDQFPKDKQIIVYCRSGQRSANVVRWLEANHGYENIYNLKGGILAWADEIDPSVQKY